MKSRLVAKVGGSLYDLPDLRDRLKKWIRAQSHPHVLLVPGGGDGAEVIRRLDEAQRIGADAAHWLALRVLTVNAHFLGELLGIPVVAAPTDDPVAMIDPHAFCISDEGNAGALPHNWDVTSDSIAARLAIVSNADLVLLKSVRLPPNLTWTQASTLGFVDLAFPDFCKDCQVSWVNLRETTPK
jgi:5-(aminomethyl)-3-furanmethanol phosphate kinase